KNYPNECEIFDPVANTWTVVTPVPVSDPFDPNTDTGGWGDEPAEVLSDGTVLVPDANNTLPVGTSTYIYNPATNSWSNGPNRLNNDTSYEENWAKLPNGQLLAI